MKLFLYRQWLVNEPVAHSDCLLYHCVTSCGTCKYFDSGKIKCEAFPTLELEPEWFEGVDYEHGCPNYKQNPNLYKRLA